MFQFHSGSGDSRRLFICLNCMQCCKRISKFQNLSVKRRWSRTQTETHPMTMTPIVTVSDEVLCRWCNWCLCRWCLIKCPREWVASCVHKSFFARMNIVPRGWKTTWSPVTNWDKSNPYYIHLLPMNNFRLPYHSHWQILWLPSFTRRLFPSKIR